MSDRSGEASSTTSEADAPLRPSHGASTAIRGFMLLYMTAFILDMAEDWKRPTWTAAMLVVVLAVIVTGLRWSGFVAFLIAATITLLKLEGFEGGNHNNLCLLSNLLLLAVFATVRVRGKWGDDAALLDWVAPPLRVSIALVYFFAGFHKLNWDYLNPAVSCGVQFAHDMTRMVHSPVKLRDLPPAVQLAPAVFVLIWELGGLGLLMRRLQLPVMLICWAMHAMLAMVVFFDFSSFAFTLLWLFIPLNQVTRLESSPLRILGTSMDRLQAYAFVNLAMSLAAGIFYLSYGGSRRMQYVQGLVFNVTFLVLMWPLARQLLPGAQKMPWSGISIWTRRTPVALALFPALIVFLGLNPYLGLRTAGVFTMFSNLRTEVYSNHLLLGSSPLKVFGYQEDLVEIIEIDPRNSRRPDRSLQGVYLPAVEFRQRLIHWRKYGPREMWATYRYRGETYDTSDIVSDSPFDLDSFDPKLWLMDFRVVQPPGEPTKCRW